MISLTQEWQLLVAQVMPTDGNGALQLRVQGQGMLFRDRCACAGEGVLRPDPKVEIPQDCASPTRVRA